MAMWPNDPGTGNTGPYSFCFMLTWLLRAFTSLSKRGPAGWKELCEGKYLSAISRLRRECLSAEETPAEYGLLGWALNSVDPWGDEAWQFHRESAQLLHATEQIEPAGLISAAFTNHRVVVLQERHAVPETQYFGVRMLNLLARAGATHLAFEHSFQGTLSEFMRTGNAYPDTVVYGFAPARAALIRTARLVHLRIVAFDFPPHRLRPGAGKITDVAAFNRDRERYMAENIVRLILSRDSMARVVVWTGEQHAMKRAQDDAWGPYMASHLAHLTGQAPLCIGQEVVDDPSLEAAPALLAGSHAWLQSRGLDAIVLHHRGNTPHCPAWVTEGKVRLEFPTNGAELIQAIPAAEGHRAVPHDQALSRSATEVALHLAPGSYLLRGLDGADQPVWQRVVSA